MIPTTRLVALSLTVPALCVLALSAPPSPAASRSGPATYSASAPHPTHVARVRIENYTFTPQTLRIAMGTTVTWTNRDDNVGHTVTSDTGRWRSSPLLFQGQQFSLTFRKPGRYPYHCMPHYFDPGMHGVVIVGPAPRQR